ncbi:MAG: HD-GYP domain-containing protein [Actinobacteria bacterium]|nr:MAG: HD-GYP domain-containing protein [Actinomycetota bacterium]
MTEEALERQLLVFANDIGALYRREQARAQELEGALRTLKTQYLETVRTLAFVVEAKDAYTGQHLERCRVYGVALLDALGVAADYPDAEFGFLLHDAGKVGIPERILNKPGPLTAAEWRVMRTHPLIGHQMLADIPFMRTAAEVVRSHHEMFDGSGYPEGLKGKDISLAARVFAVVDAFDAMTTDRPYRAALSLDHAVTEIERMAGTQFDPEVVKVFLPLCERLRPAS